MVVPADGDETPSQADTVSELAHTTGRSVATVESLTGGHISCLLGAAPGSSDWFRGCIVAYSRDVKHGLLRVPPGPVVSEACARVLATNGANLLGADTAVAVTGAGGPESQDGQDAGTVWFGLFDRGTVTAERHTFAGDPADVIEQTARHALGLLVRALASP